MFSKPSLVLDWVDAAATSILFLHLSHRLTFHFTEQLEFYKYKNLNDGVQDA